MGTTIRLFAAAAIMALAHMGSAAVAAPKSYQVGDVLIYDNPYDETPARKGRVTRVTGDQVWVDFSEFQPGLNIAEASKILYKGNQVDDFTRPADAAPTTVAPPAPGGSPPVPPPPN